jgi:phosphate starvation-inducible PhoH-like protein
MASKRRKKAASNNNQQSSPIEVPPKRFRPLSKSQQQAYETIGQYDITFLIGPAGTAKTHTAAAWAIEAIKSGKYEKAIFTRPIVEACESLGWLPGTIDEKIAPYMAPLNICADKVGRGDIKIESAPIAYLRGVTFENSVAILDEAQNCTRPQLKLYLTRFGRGSKMIICGDSSQSDIRGTGLDQMVHDLTGVDGIGVHIFSSSDTVRHPLVERIINRLSECGDT